VQNNQEGPYGSVTQRKKHLLKEEKRKRAIKGNGEGHNEQEGKQKRSKTVNRQTLNSDKVWEQGSLPVLEVETPFEEGGGRENVKRRAQ